MRIEGTELYAGREAETIRLQFRELRTAGVLS
jgi:hypothetical protein